MMARKITGRVNNAWTDDELRLSVDAYVLLLRLQARVPNDRAEPLAQFLLHDALDRRNDASIRYRMRNISAVVKELGLPILRDFSPAESVGRSIRSKIRAMLLDNSDFSKMLRPNADIRSDAISNARIALDLLRAHLEELDRDFEWRDHNRPPEDKEYSSERSHIKIALEDISVIEKELERPNPNKDVVRRSTNKLIELTALISKWVGVRATKFVDAALVAAAPIAVIKITGLLPPLLNAVEAVLKAVPF